MTLAALLPALAAAALAQPSRFELAPSTPTVEIGRPVEIVGSATFPERFALDPDLPKQETGPFEVLGVSVGAPSAQGGARTVEIRLRVAAFELGDVALPALSWRLRGEGRSAGEIRSPPVRLKVTGPELPEGSDIRDIAGPLHARFWPWLLPGALALAALAWRLRSRLRKPAPEAAGAAVASDLRTPDQRALDELEELASSDLPAKEYYDRLSDILREYLGWRYDLPALKLTTGDLHRRLVKAAIDPKARTALKTLLERSDLAKFARLLPPKEARMGDNAAAQDIVRATRPAPPEPAVQELKQ